VDGRSFFGEDMQMATKNLPADIIDKVQVTNDGEERNASPDKGNAALGQVINLKLKKDIRKGWFGKAYAGAGTDNRHEAGTILNLFRDTTQISIIGFLNNLNRSAFGVTDINNMGGFKRSGIATLNTGGGGLSINGISFGGGGEGIQRSAGAGFNLNNILGKNTQLNTQYFYGEATNDISEINDRRQFIQDTILRTYTIRKDKEYKNNHRVGLSLKAHPDSLLSIVFKPLLVVSGGHSDADYSTNNSNNIEGMLNIGNNIEHVEINKTDYSHTLSIIKGFRKKGRNISFYQKLNYTHKNSNNFNDVLNVFSNEDTTFVNQLRNNNTDSWSVNTTINYNEPITPFLAFRAIYNLHFINDKFKVNTFSKNVGSNKYDTINPLLSGNFERDVQKNKLGAGISWTYKSLVVTPLLNVLTMNSSHHLKSYFFPGLNIDWKELSFSYSASVNPPEINDIQPVPDNTNPLYIIKSNPQLRPSTVHNFYLYIFKPVMARNLYYSIYVNADLSRDAVINRRTIDANGVQTIMALNDGDKYDIASFSNINKQFHTGNNTTLTTTIGYDLSFRKNNLIVNDYRFEVNTLNLTPILRNGINWNDKFEWNFSYSWVLYNTRYSNPNFAPLNVHRQSLATDIVIRYPVHFVWEASLDYQYNALAAPGIQKNRVLLNGGLIYQFLHKNKGQLKLSVFDVLNQNVAVTRYSVENYINDRQINVLTRYFLLTFTYNIRNFRPGKIGGKQTLLPF
jgi:hypothetical protein